jgi:uncharacterized RDD family membrane protein YckC
MKPLLDGIAWMILLPALLAGASLGQGIDEGASNDLERPLVEALVEEQAAPREGAERRPLSRPREVLQLGGAVEIAEGEEAQDAVVIFGDVHVRGTVRGDLVVVFGRATVDGEIRGSLVAPFSRIALGSGARIGGDLVAVLGELKVDSAAQIGGQRIDFSMTLLEEQLPAMEAGKAWVTQGLLWARPLPHQAGWWWGFALGCAVLYFLMALIFPRPLALSVDALETRPVVAFFLGLLVLVMVGPMLLMLAATGIGLIVVPFVLAALLVAFLFGKVAVAQYLGRELGRQLGMKFLMVPMAALLIGIGILYLVYMVPLLGLLVWSLTGMLGIGAASIALFGAFRIETVASRDVPMVRGQEMRPPVATSSPLVRGSTERPMVIEPDMEAVVPTPEQAVVDPEIPPQIPGQKPVFGWVEASSLPRVGFWPRLGATLIDLILIGLLVALLQRGAWFIPIWVAYHVAMWAWRGTTIGGIVLGLRVARLDGRPLDLPVALIRSLSSFLSALALFLGFFWAGWTRKKQAWHDLIAGTMIVRMPKGASPL